jgi:uncharacterized protein (TIGR03000 family)
MSQRFVSLLTTGTLAVGALVMAAGPVLAQRGGHGGGHGGGFHGGFSGGHFRGGFHGSGFRGGFHRGFRDGFRDGFFRGEFRDGFGRGFFRGGFFPGFYGYGLGFGPGLCGYGLGLGRGFYGYGSSYASSPSGYGSASAGYSGPAVSGYYSPPAGSAPVAVRSAGYGTDLADNLGYVRMEVPADAEIWIDGVKTSQTGPVRTFVSQPLDPGQKCVYQVRARWTENGRTVEQTRQVNVRANARTNVDFNRPAPGTETLPVPKNR